MPPEGDSGSALVSLALRAFLWLGWQRGTGSAWHLKGKPVRRVVRALGTCEWPMKIRAMPHWKKRPMELTRHCSRSEDGSWCPRDLPLDQSDVGDFKNNIFEIQIPTVLTVFKESDHSQ